VVCNIYIYIKPGSFIDQLSDYQVIQEVCGDSAVPLNFMRGMGC
jgi:hypothetical protein